MAVLSEIKKTKPDSEIRFWCDRKFFSQAASIIANFDADIKVEKIIAGKFRRYHHVSWLRQLTWLSVVLLNIRDAFFALTGYLESLVKMMLWRPDVVFTKGGYVCLPVGLAARTLNIPLVIHDSDAHPGLTNRILGKWATMIATGAPLEYYNYPLDKARYVGIPVAKEFREFSTDEQLKAKEQWGINPSRPLVVVTGGGLGASRINDAVVLRLDKLLTMCSIVLISGIWQYDEIRSLTPENSENFQLHAFVSKDMASLMGAADIVVARAGATTILELAALAKPTILVPNAKLTGGHQLKNAAVYLKESAVKLVNDEVMVQDPDILVKAIRELLDDPKHSQAMGRKLQSFSRPNAARDVADMIISAYNKA